MKKKKWEKIQKNNQGFSLLELLISVTILAIIVIPMMHSFVTSARTNAKAKKVMEATSAGQNVIEAVKADSLTPDSSGYTQTEVELPSGNKVSKWTKRETATVNNRTFWMDITLDPTDYIENTDYKSYNDMDIPQVATMDPAVSAIFTMQLGTDEMAARQLNPENPSDAAAAMTREIALDLYKDVSGKAVVEVQVTYTYGTQVYTMYSTSNKIFEADTLENVYVLFQPMFNCTGKGSPTEHIVVRNYDNLPVNLYLIKQKQTGETSIELNSYGVSAAIHESSASHTITRVITNLATVNTVADKGFLNVTLTRNGTSVSNPLSAVGLTEDNAKDDVTPWVKTDKNTIIYKVEVKVYDEEPKDDGTTEPLATFEGTKMQ